MILIIGLIQLFPFIRKERIIIHRILGNVYIFAAIVTGLGGNIYIYKQGCVGGVMMDVIKRLQTIMIITDIKGGIHSRAAEIALTR